MTSTTEQRPHSSAGGKRGAAVALGRARGLLDRPLASYYLVLGATLLLLAIGLVMVLSTSTAYALDYGQPPYVAFQKQLAGAAAGLVAMWLAARAGPRLFRRLAYPLVVVAIIGLVLAATRGVTVYGAERWVNVGGLALQPSEFGKLAFLVWGADLLARKEALRQLGSWRGLLIPLLPGATIACLLVMLGDDIGTTFLLLVIFLSLLWVIGAPGRLFVGMLGLIVFALLLMIVVQPNRLQRLTGFFHSGSNVSGAGWQLTEGKYALGSGGPFGVGLGASQEKWGWVPNSTTDFIFAILGEELGLIGTLCVTALYGVLGYAGLRIARRMRDTFMRLAAAAVTIWIVAQATVNIGAVLGLLPITGVPLPLISEGLSSLLVTLAAIGMLLSFAKHEPGAELAISGRDGVARHLGAILSWLGLGGGGEDADERGDRRWWQRRAHRAGAGAGGRDSPDRAGHRDNLPRHQARAGGEDRARAGL